ncbi:MAG: NTP transferase domain-containing protein, partial [Pseudomonadota bacterium]
MPKHNVFMAVLAAGSSRRFGPEDKLAQRFRGQRLGQHVCRNAPVDWLLASRAFVITSSLDHPCQPAWLDAGFRVAMNPDADQGMGSSVANAARRAIKM